MAQKVAKAVKPSAGKSASAAMPLPAVAPNAARPQANEETIRQLAYSKWESAGRPLGDGLHFWLAAEAECCRA